MSERVAKHYPIDALATDGQSVDEKLDAITTSDVRTLDELFRERVRRSPDKVAYSQFNHTSKNWYGVSWAEIAGQVELWQVAFREHGLVKGDRVAICYRNSIEWVVFDQAALRLGLIVVPLYTADRADNIAYVIADSRSKLVLLENPEDWAAIADSEQDLNCVEIVVVVNDGTDLQGGSKSKQTIIPISSWLPQQGQHMERGVAEADGLASIVYTSGTTGRPKGVMLSHKNMLSNAYSGMRSVALKTDDRLLSFLPLSHTLERTVGYYAAMLCGASVAFNRSIPELSEDFLQVKPTVMVSVPRIFERIHNGIYAKLSDASAVKRSIFKRAIKTGWHQFQYQQGEFKWHPRMLLGNLLDRAVAQTIRDLLGGNLRFVVVGGAPLSIDVAKTFISLGVPLLQGYGLTETSPVVSVNTLECNRPDSIGLPLRGVSVKLIDNDELLVKGETVMQGYWGLPEATAKTMQDDWLKTGDRAAIDEQGYIRIIGRIKDILVLANGEKVPPPDIEAAILRDPLFEQVMIVGEGKAYLSALLVLERQQWRQLCVKQRWDDQQANVDVVQEFMLKRVAAQMDEFPGYARIRRVYISLDEWTIEAGLLTPTLKIKRPKVLDHFKSQIEQLYAGHGVHKS